ncbi:MAG: S-layer family protein [Scytolyngbya sp. HA4215-MV1]|jgi:large exoprotein involved in heme utilization and adhesion|nr:S-layer family protein [Scytolyngbya sp. HA4215-MV1]
MIYLSAKKGSILGNTSFLNSFSGSKQGASGNGGKVTLEAGNEISGLEINTVASGGLAGDVEVNGFGTLTVANTRVLTAQQVEVKPCPICDPIQINLSGKGQAGNVTVTSTDSLTFRDSLIQSDTRSSNRAGNITLVSPGVVTFNNSQILSNTSSTGQAGSIDITANQGILLDSTSTLSAQNSDQGNAGSILLNTPLLNLLSGASITTSTTSNSQGNAGNITIQPELNGQNLTINFEPGSAISASTTGSGRGGTITLIAPDSITLSGAGSISAETSGSSAGGNVNMSAQQLTLQNGVVVSASTTGAGTGGSVILQIADRLLLTGQDTGLFAGTESGSTGKGGSVAITTNTFNMADNAEVSASTAGSGLAGSIQLIANNATLESGARITSNTSSTGNAGDIGLNVIETLQLTGSGTGIFASTTPGSSGNGGSILIDPQLVQIADGAAIVVDSKGSGIGGSIQMHADRLVLDRRGSITAETASTQGGNITLNIRDILLMRYNSLISTTAGTAQAGGDGGKITIAAPFIVGVLSENSDITANAFSGAGGNISIDTQGIFGLQVQPQLTPNSDITASSQLGINGSITINNPTIDPSQGLTELPGTPIDPSNQITEACASTGTARQGKFTIVGRGGLPTSPDDLFTGTSDSLAEPVSLVPTSQVSAATGPATTTATPPEAIVEAQGWVTDAKGNTYLVAQLPTTPHAAGVASPTCNPVRP